MSKAKTPFFSAMGNRLDAIVGAFRAKAISQLARAFQTGSDTYDGIGTKYYQPYAQSPWIFSGINLVSGEFTGLPLKFYAGAKEYSDPKLEAWWEAPALGSDKKRLNRSQVDQLLAMWLQLEGEFFILLDASWAVPFPKGDLPPFIIGRPDRVRLIVQGGDLQGYVWSDAGGRQHVFLPEQVIHKLEPNPYDDWRGIGRAKIATVAAEGAFLTGNYIRELMRNNGDQGFIVIGKNGVADDTQRAQIIADLRAKRQALRAGMPKDLFLTGDITIDRPTEQAAGVDLTNTTSLSHQEIYVSLGIPPSMTAVKAAYSIGKDSDRYQLITGTSQPLSRKITGAYGELASRQTRKALTAEHYWDDHPVMQEVRTARIETALKLWASGMSWMDVNDYLDLGMEPFPGWEIPYLPFSVTPVDLSGAKPAPADPGEDPALGEMSRRRSADLPEIAALRLLFLTRSRQGEAALAIQASATQLEAEVLAGFTCNCGAGVVTQKADRPAKEITLWRQQMAQRRESIQAYKSAFGRLLTEIRIETLRNIEGESGKALLAKRVAPDQAATKTAASDFLFDLSKFKDRFTATMRKQGTAALNKAGEQLFSELGRSDPFTFAPQEVLSFLGDRENRMRNVPEDVFGRIKDSLQEGLDAGDSTTDLADRVRAEFNSLGKGEAQRIAQTEVSAAYGFGRQAAMKKAGIKFKQWLTSGNANVRPAHAEANLQTVPIDEPFIVDGEELMHPGDSSGSAGNVINCHCVSLAKADAES